MASLDDGRTIWLAGEKISNITESPAFRNAARSFANLYDLASNSSKRSVFFESTGADQLLRAFQIPIGLDDLRAKRQMHEAWARESYGFLGRTPDYIASGLAGFAASSEIFKSDDFDGSANALSLYRKAAAQSLFVSFTLTNIRKDRRAPLSGQPRTLEDIGMRVVKETDAGIVVSGVKAIATGAIFSDDILVGSIEPLDTTDVDYGLTFVVAPGTHGVSLYSRPSYEAAATSVADMPLASRFDENDAILVLDSVFIPWERVLTYRDPSTTFRIWWFTSAYANMAHQASIRFSVKLDFLAGLAVLVAKSSGGLNNPAIRTTVGRLLGYAEIARSMVLGAEADFESVPGNTNAIAPNRRIVYAQRIMAGELYPKFVHELRMLCGGSLVHLPNSLDDLEHPEIGPVIRTYLETAESDALYRGRLLKLVWDATSSDFASRHAHYEQFYQGAPHVYFMQMTDDAALDKAAAYASQALAHHSS